MWCGGGGPGTCIRSPPAGELSPSASTWVTCRARLAGSAACVAATALVCALSYLPVAALARDREPSAVNERWKSPDVGDIPGEVTVQLLVVAGAAAVGRYVLKIRL